MNRLTACLICLLVAAPAMANTISKSEAQKKVASIEEADSKTLSLVPTLQPLSDFVKVDCMKRVPELAKSPTFCACASALTMELWLSGIDPEMKKRVVSYATAPSNVDDFAQYEGPELYRPLCENAEPN